MKTENLTHYYENGMAGAVAAIENINVKFEKGEIVGIIGHTGSGKSTLLQHLNGLLKPDSGRVLLAARITTKISAPCAPQGSELGFVSVSGVSAF